LSQYNRPAVPRRASARPKSRLDWLYTHRFWIGGALAGLLILFVVYIGWTLRDLPDPSHQDVLANTIIVYDRNGNEIEQRNSKGQFHVILPLDQMGKYGPAATLAAEDRDFYKHGAIDIPATMRALFVDLTNRGYAQGGSTITQQLVKIQLLTPQKSIFRKFQEAILAEGVERKYSKDQILNLYLNRVYYGHGAYGLGAAAKTYFGKDKQVKDLTPAQAAFLAAMIQAPTYYDPVTHYARAKARQAYVLDGMVKTGALTRAEADQAAQEDIQKEIHFDIATRQSKAPHFVDYLMTRLESDLGSAAIQQGGFKVYTTLDLNLQAQAENAVRDGVSKLKYGGVNNGMLMAAKPDTGEILAWVGSADYYNEQIGGQFDVVLSPRSPGSSFKPYVYETALKDRKITLATQLDDKPTTFGGNYKPLDYDNRFMGKMSARRALVLSRNVPAVAVADKEGIDNVNNVAKQFGIRTELKPFLSTAIGGSDVTMYDHLQGYQVFANQGHKVQLNTIKKVVDSSGGTIYEGQRVDQSDPVSKGEAYLITDVLKDYQNQWRLGWRRQMASKSGTSGGNEVGVHPDAWMMAYNPNIVVGAWGGNTAANGAGKPVSIFGVDVGSTMLADFINGLPANMRDWYQRPSGIVDGHGCPGDPDQGHEIFLQGTENQAGCSAPSPTPTPTSTPTPTPTETPTPPPSIAPTRLPTVPPTQPPGPSSTPSPQPSR
jgi:membrane peptidoglycan carboxypeptidase